MMTGIGVGLAFGAIFLMFSIGMYADIKSTREKRRSGVQIEMIRARLMLLSTSPKEIEEFLMNKEPYITQEMIEQLINRVAEIKADEAINKDWNVRVEASPQNFDPTTPKAEASPDQYVAFDGGHHQPFKK